MLDYTIVENGKELEYFSEQTLNGIIKNFLIEVAHNKEKKDGIHTGSAAFTDVKNLEGEKVNVWIEWEAVINGTGLNLGITNLIFYKSNTIPDVVLNRMNTRNKIK